MKKPVTVVLSDDTRAMLANEAAQLDRSRSWVADHLLREGLEARRAAQPATTARGITTDMQTGAVSMPDDALDRPWA